MLQLIRDRAQGVLVWAIVGLIIITFALFGLSSYLSGSSSNFVAEVNGVEIDENQFRRELQNYQERLKQMFGKNYRADMFNPAVLKNEVVNKLVMRELMSQYLENEKFFVSQNTLFGELKNVDAFKDESGKFDTARYKDLIKRQGMTEAFFEQQVARDITARYLNSGVSQTEFVTASEAENKLKLDDQQRDIGYLTINRTDYLKNAQASAAELEAYYNSHLQEFMTTEQVSIEYVELQLEAVAKRYEIDDKAVRDQYENHRLNYILEPEKRKVSHILIKVDKKTTETQAKKRIQDIGKEIKSGKSFAKMAKKHSQDPGSAKKGGDLGFFGRGVMDKAFEKSAFDLKKGAISEPVRSSFGFHLIKVDSIKAETIKPFKDVREQIRRELQIQQAQQTFFTDADQLNNISYEQPDSLMPIVDKLGLELKTSGLFTRSGGPGIAANPKVVAAVFNPDVLGSGRNSDMIEISDTHLVVLRMKEHKPAVQKKLQEVRDIVQARLKAQIASNQVKESTSKAMQRLQNGESPKQVAKSIQGAKWQKVGLISRNASLDKSAVGKQVANDVRRYSFTLAKPQANKISWGSTTSGSGNGIVVGLYAVKQSDSTADKTKLQQEKQRLTQVQGNAMFNQLLQHLRKEAKVTINLPKDEQL